MRLVGHDVAPNEECEALGMEYVDRKRLFAESDLLSLHAPLGPETCHVVDAGALALMKDDAILINTSRGGLLDAHALVETLRAGRLEGVGLDVYEEEAGVFFFDKSLEVMTDDTLARLMTFRNVLNSSHQAYFTRDAVGQIVQTTADDIADHLAKALVPGATCNVRSSRRVAAVPSLMTTAWAAHAAAGQRRSSSPANRGSGRYRCW